MTNKERRDILKRGRAAAAIVAALGAGDCSKAEAAGAALAELQRLAERLEAAGLRFCWRGDVLGTTARTGRENPRRAVSKIGRR